MARGKTAAALLLALLYLAAHVPAPEAGETANSLAFRFDPSEIRMGAFYSGARCRITGEASCDAAVLAVIKGPQTKEEFKKKRRAGPIWINGGTVSVSGAPSLFLRFASEPAENILGAEILDARLLDERSIANRLKVEPSGPDDRLISENYFKLKKQQGAYAIADGAIRMTRNPGGNASFVLDFAWPKKAPPGLYEAWVFECADGRIRSEASAPVRVVETGFPAWLAGLARDKASVYGMFAVIAALIGGLGIDLLASLLGKRPAAGH